MQTHHVCYVGLVQRYNLPLVMMYTYLQRTWHEVVAAIDGYNLAVPWRSPSLMFPHGTFAAALVVGPTPQLLPIVHVQCLMY